jgi:hypothetical protein
MARPPETGSNHPTKIFPLRLKFSAKGIFCGGLTGTERGLTGNKSPSIGKGKQPRVDCRFGRHADRHFFEVKRKFFAGASARGN